MALTHQYRTNLIKDLAQFVNQSVEVKRQLRKLTTDMDSIKDRQDFLKTCINVEEDVIKSRDLIDDLQRTLDKKRFQNRAIKEKEEQLDELYAKQTNIRDYLRNTNG